MFFFGSSFGSGLTTMMMASTSVEGALLKIPSLGIISPSPRLITRSSSSLRFRLHFGVRAISSASAAEATPVPPPVDDSKLGPGSLGHVTRPDFPILHQVGSRVPFLMMQKIRSSIMLFSRLN